MNNQFNLGPLGTLENTAINQQALTPSLQFGEGINIPSNSTLSGQFGVLPNQTQQLQPGQFGNLFGGKGGFGSNLQLGLGALQTVGGLWQAYNANKLAKESIGLQKQAYQENSANQKKSYNTALEDRIRARYATEGKSDAQADNYINENKL